MTFHIKAEKIYQGRWWRVNFEMESMIMSDLEWQAFKSLLMPSAKADFILTETDHKQDVNAMVESDRDHDSGAMEAADEKNMR